MRRIIRECILALKTILVLAPLQKGGRLNYFMDPYAEADGKALDDLFGLKLRPKGRSFPACCFLHIVPLPACRQASINRHFVKREQFTIVR